MKKKIPNFFPIFLLILLGLTWSLGYAIARYCITHGVNPLGYSFWQSLGPAIALCLIMLWTRTSFCWSKKHLAYYIFCAILGIAFPNSLMYFAAGHLPSGMLAILVNTVPIFTYPLALMAKQESFQFKRILPVLLGCVGIFWLIWPAGSISSMSTGWTLLTLLTPLSFACCSVFIASHQPTPATRCRFLFGMLLFSSLCLAPFVFGTHSFYAFHLKTLSFTDFLILLEIGLSTLGYVVFFALLRLAGPVYYSMVGGVVAIAGLFWGKFFFHEDFLLREAFPILLILIAIIALNFPRKLSKPSPSARNRERG